MTIKRRMGIIFSSLIVLSILFTSVFVLTISFSQSITLDKTIASLNDRYIDHLVWGQRLSHDIIDDITKPITIQLDHTRCLFGQWYYKGDWKGELKGIPEALVLLEQIETPHKQLHASAQHIFNNQQNGLYDDIHDIYLQETVPILTKLGTIFSELRDIGIMFNEQVAHQKQTIEQNSKIFSVSIGILLIAISIFGAITAVYLINSLGDVLKISCELGKGNFSLNIDPKKLAQRTEIGDMMRSTDTMIKNVRETIRSIRQIGTKLLESGFTMSTNTEETYGQVDSMQNQVQSVHKFSMEQSESISTVSKSISGIIQNISNLDKSVAIQANEVVHSSANIEQMIQNVSSINDNITKVYSEFDNLVHASEDGKNKLTLVEKEIDEIMELSEALRETNKLIASIAAQTNLLAMNAAIESAHAGSAGQGFAVVADEIRKLAEKSSIQSKQITRQLKDIHTGVSSIVDASKDTRVAFETISVQIHNTDNLVSELHTSVSEQSTGSQQVLESIKTITNITGSVKNNANEMEKNSSSILKEIDDLNQITGKVSSSMHEVIEGTAEIHNESRLVLTAVKDTKTLIDEIDAALSQFSV